MGNRGAKQKTPSPEKQLNPLSGKTVLNNSKLTSSALNIQIPQNTQKASITAAGSASTVFENNSSLHKFNIDPELDGVLFDDHHQETQHAEGHEQHITTKDRLNTSGAKKLSNKFVGLTEFDETKIPALPDDINSNIEEQYNITFEECFIPTLTAQQEIKNKVTDEFSIDDRTHLLLPTEADTISSDNETFADCNDERDALATTFCEIGNVDATTDLESYRSAGNNTINEMSINDTMESIDDLPKEVETHPLQKANGIHVMEEFKTEQNQINDHLQDEEPMDVDMNSTLEIIQNTCNNIQPVENVLQHTANILQHIEEKQHIEAVQQVNSSLDIHTSLDRRTESINNFETEQSKGEITLEKTVELPTEIKNINSECNIEQNKSVTDELQNSKMSIIKDLSVTVDCINSSVISNSSTKSDGDEKGETKLSINISNSVITQKSSAPSSPSFPIKHAQNEGFPRSPKALVNKQPESPFLEKSNFADNFESENKEEKPVNGIFVKECSQSIKLNWSSSDSNSNGNSDDNGKCLQKTSEEFDANAKNKRKTFSVDPEISGDKRRTFNIPSHESQVTDIQFPAAFDKPADNADSTFCLNETSTKPEVDINPRRTFNINLEEKETEPTAMDISFEPMQQRSQSPSVPVTKQKSLSPPLPTLRQNTQSPSLPTMLQKSQSPPLPLSQTVSEEQQRSNSPPLPVLQQSLQSPAMPAVQQRSQSPPLPALKMRSQSPLLPAMQKNQLSSLQQPAAINKEDQISAALDNVVVPLSSLNPHSQPLPTLIQKRPSIRDIRRRPDTLSAKEQSSIKVKDEKDVIVEKCTPSPIEEIFQATSTTTSEFVEFDQASWPTSSLINNKVEEQQDQFMEEFGGNNNIIFNPSDFDYLLTKGNSNTTVDRSSLLLKFDPFLGVPVPVNQGPQQQQQLQQLQLQIPTNTINPYLSPTLEEDEHSDSNRLFVIETKSANGKETAVDGVVGGLTETSAKLLKERSQENKQQSHIGPQAAQKNKTFLKQEVNKKNATMSVDVIKDMSLDNDCNKAYENSNSTQLDDKQINYKMDELEKKIKNEVLKTEDIEKKLKDAEQREEALIKRITEKDKTVAKMTGVIEAYEKAIAELIAEKEQLTQNYEKQLAEVKADRDSNYHHLTSLETTFSDLHVKYEKSKEMTCQLKASEEALQAEKRKNLENLHLQEQRYDKMKNHAMQQLEIANKKLESLTRDHSIEITKLKALLKKEEIARSSINEQLAQKTKENAELVKICDELIANQGS